MSLLSGRGRKGSPEGDVLEATGWIQGPSLQWGAWPPKPGLLWKSKSSVVCGQELCDSYFAGMAPWL